MPDDVKPEGVDEQGKEASPAAGAKADDKLPFNEHPRWKEVYGALQEYKKYGNVGDIEAKLQRAAELEEAFAEAQAMAAAEAEEAGKTKGEKDSEELMRQARAELRRLLPELGELESLKAAQAARYQRLEQAAISETRAVLKEIGEEDSVGEVRAMSDILADIIKNDAGLYSEYEVNPKGAVRGAFEKFSKRFQAKGDRAAAAAKQKDRESAAKLPKSHGAGGSGEGQGGEGAPKNLAEATQRAMARLKGMEL